MADRQQSCDLYNIYKYFTYGIGHVTAGGLPAGTVGTPPQNSDFGLWFLKNYLFFVYS